MAPKFQLTIGANEAATNPKNVVLQEKVKRMLRFELALFAGLDKQVLIILKIWLSRYGVISSDQLNRLASREPLRRLVFLDQIAHTSDLENSTALNSAHLLDDTRGNPTGLAGSRLNTGNFKDLRDEALV